ncbi:MAG: exodeoxyribonuclease V subunit gamma, partial [Nostocoides sp.]
MALHVHRGTRADLLAEDLAAILAVPPHDPFAPEIVIVPARGVERWLTQRLSHRLGALHGDDGVCAGVQFLSPNSLVTLLLGTDRDDPWLPDQLLWPLLSTIDTSLDEEWAHSLAAHLGHHQDGAAGRLRAGRRY